jgi:hypothetical protein
MWRSLLESIYGTWSKHPGEGQQRRFTGNSADEEGGGLCTTFGSPIIQNNTFTGNSAVAGGGIYINQGSAIIRNNIVVNNIAGNGGVFIT